MIKNFKQRFYTSTILLFLLFLMLINNYFFGYILIISGIFCLMEFFKIMQIVFKKNILKLILSNFLFILYIFAFCSLILIFSFNLNLKILIFVIIITCVGSDIGGYIFGKLFKGPKLSKISPNKTIAGAIGSIIFSIFLITLLTLDMTKNFNVNFLAVGAITSIGCQIGDLFFSLLKRKSNLKDTGKYLPGHGGILDRVDGILLGVPLGVISLITLF